MKVDFSNRQKARLSKYDALTLTVSELLGAVDVLKFSSEANDLFFYLWEANKIVKSLRKINGELSEYTCTQMCIKFFLEWDKELTQKCKEWPQIGAVIFWLIQNEGKWENKI